MEKAKRGSIWVTFTNIATRFLTLLTTIILARWFLGPEDFGVFGVLMIMIEIINQFSFKGLSDAIIYVKNVDKKLINTIFWFSLLVGTFFCFALWGLAPVLAGFFHHEQIKEILKVASFIFITNSFNIIPLVLLRKELLFKKESIALLTGQIVYMVTTIILAQFGLKVYAIIYGLLARSVALAIVSSILAKYFPGFRLDLKNFRKIFLYINWVTGETIVIYIFSKVDQIIIGRTLGMNSLGYYTTAFNLVMNPLYLARATLHKIMFSTYTKIQDDFDLLKKSFLKISNRVSMIFIPIFVGAVVIGDVFILSIYGEKWRASIPIMQILSLNVLIKFIGNTLPQVMKAVGKPNYLFWYNVIRTIVLIPVVYVASFHGIQSIAWTVFLISLIFKPLEIWMLNRAIGVNAKEYIETFITPLMASLVMSGMIFVAKYSNALPVSIFSLLVYIVLGVAAYYISFLIINDKQLDEFKYFVKNYLN